MIVLRIQDSIGAGMYSTDKLCVNWNEPGKHPMPMQDGLLAPRWRDLPAVGKYLFGFRDAAQCLSWVYDPKMWEYLHKGGLFVAEYEVSDALVLVGYTQVVFPEDAVTLKRLTPCWDWFRLNGGLE